MIKYGFYAHKLENGSEVHIITKIHNYIFIENNPQLDVNGR